MCIVSYFSLVSALIVIQGVFFLTGSPLKMCRPPPKFVKRCNHIHFAWHLDVFRSFGGPVWDFDVFWNQLLTRQHLSKSGEARSKNYPVGDSSLRCTHFPNCCDGGGGRWEQVFFRDSVPQMEVISNIARFSWSFQDAQNPVVESMRPVSLACRLWATSQAPR